MQRGSILPITLVIVFVAVITLTALVGLVTRSDRESVLQAQDETAFQIAESGLNYARWRLAHDPQNFVAETRTMNDQFAGSLGQFTVTFSQTNPGTSLVSITSNGQTTTSPDRSVTLKAQYGRPSLARYSALYNDNYWFGTNDVIKGAVHANGGIRMDGTSDSTMSSAKTTYLCTSTFGCSNETKPGIWGTGSNQNLWQFPVAPIDYSALTLDLLNIKDQAQRTNTYYGSSHKSGYHIVFNNDNTYSIYIVNSLKPKVKSWTPDTGWKNLSHDIDTQSLVETKSVQNGSVIFVEDTVWVEGHIRNRVTLAAGVLPDTPATNADIIINGNITYDGTRDGSRTFGAIAQRDIIIPYWAASDILTINGAFIAQKGSFGRRYYDHGDPDTQNLAIRSQLNIYGMVGLNHLDTDTTWVSGSTIVSGYRLVNREYDANFLYAPPPFFPSTGQYEMLSWDQQ